MPGERTILLLRADLFVKVRSSRLRRRIFRRRSRWARPDTSERAWLRLTRVERLMFSSEASRRLLDFRYFQIAQCPGSKPGHRAAFGFFPR